MTQSFNGQRLQALRDLEGLTQGTLAERLGVTQPTISQIEKSERPLRTELVEKASREFRLPASFFSVPPSLLDISFPTFRKSSKARVIDERRIVRQYREAARMFETASRLAGYKEAVTPAELATLDPDEAASAVRELGGLSPEGPVTNMTRLLERLGFGVITQLDTAEHAEDPQHAGISIPSAGSRRPLIALTSAQPGAVMRFTLAHELAHHIWDRESSAPSTSRRSPQERKAHNFAGALLLPHSVMRARVSESLNLDAYLAIKSAFGVSVGAIILRAARLGLISAERARSLQIQLSSRGWRRQEPVEVAVERPLLIKQSLERVTGPASRDIEELFGLPARMVYHWTGLTPPPASDAVVDLAQWRKARTSSGK